MINDLGRSNPQNTASPYPELLLPERNSAELPLSLDEQIALIGYSFQKEIRANMRKQGSPNADILFKAMTESFESEEPVSISCGRRTVLIETRLEHSEIPDHANPNRLVIELTGVDGTSYTLIKSNDYFLLELGPLKFLNETFFPSVCHQVVPILDKILEGARFAAVNALWERWSR